MTKLSFEPIILKAASLGDVNPMPDLKNVSYIHAKFETTTNVTPEDKIHFGKGAIETLLPYLSQDGYDRKLKDTVFQAAILENDYLRAVFLPEMGGRLWSLYHKKLEKELLYVNEIVQPANLALRNAWVAGGVEWNVGIKGHSTFTCEPMFVAESENEKGEKILSMYEYERIRQIVYGINVYLDGECLYVRTTVENKSDKDTYMYWWSNIAVPEEGVRVLTDAEEMFSCLYEDNHYTIDKMKAPYFEGEDMSYPERAFHAGDLFFITNKERRKWIASVEKDGIGLLQYSTPELKGRKVFFWGKGVGGRNWNKFLCGSNRNYIEIQAGLLNTQMEHVPMPAHSCWTWTEAYTVAKISTEDLQKDWKEACKVMAEEVQALPNPGEADIPLNASKIIRSYGSGWGAYEQRVISDFYEFPLESMSEIQEEWIFLRENGYLQEQSYELPPKSYYVTEEALALLEKSLKRVEGNHWYTWLHIGVIRYSLKDIEGAEEAWKTSCELLETPWSHRNLAMLYKNIPGQEVNAVYHIARATELCTFSCRGLLVDAAMIMTGYGSPEKWLPIYMELPEELKGNGRLRFLTAVAYMKCGQIEKAKEIINENFAMSDIKEGELSISAVWEELYGEEKPLPDYLNFRMYER